MSELPKCRDGEIGRRSGLKIRRAQKACGGSIPPPGTTGQGQPIRSAFVRKDSDPLLGSGHCIRSGALIRNSVRTVKFHPHWILPSHREPSRRLALVNCSTKGHVLQSSDGRQQIDREPCLVHATTGPHFK
jgi:hypothetical protein